MVRNATVVLFLIVMAGAPLAAQEDKPAEVKQERGSATQARPAALGDVITFTSGKQLKGMQVLRETSRLVVIQIIPGSEPLILSKRFVERIDYDDILPEKVGVAEVPPPAPAPNVIVADRLSGELHKNLNRPLPTALLRTERDDLVRILEKLGRATGVRIDISSEVRALPGDRRRWRYSVKKETSLESLLRENLLVRFKQLRVLYRFDHIVVTTMAGNNSTREAKS